MAHSVSPRTRSRRARDRMRTRTGGRSRMRRVGTRWQAASGTANTTRCGSPVGPAAGALAGTGRRRSPRCAGRPRHPGGDRLSGRARGRPHNEAVGPRQTNCRARRSGRQSRWRTSTPNAQPGSPSWRSTLVDELRTGREPSRVPGRPSRFQVTGQTSTAPSARWNARLTPG